MTSVNRFKSALSWCPSPSSCSNRSFCSSHRSLFPSKSRRWRTRSLASISIESGFMASPPAPQEA
jgi:hypothetical protein